MVAAWLVALADEAGAGCADPEARVTTLEHAVLEGRWEDVPRATDELLDTFGCGPVAEREVVARMWLAEALLRSSRDGEAAAAGPLAAALRTSPATWNDNLGPKLHRAWEDAARASAPATGVLQADVPAGWVAAVDGVLQPLPIEVPAGLHLVQLGPTPAQMVSASRVDLRPGAELVLPPPVDLPRPPDPRRTRRLTHAAAVGGASVGVYLLTLGTRAAFYGSAPADVRLAMATTNNALVIASAAGAATAGGLTVRAFVAPAPAIAAVAP